MLGKKEKDNYIKRIRNLLPVCQKVEKQYLHDLSDSIDRYCEQHPDTSVSDIEEHFGDPNQVVHEYVDATDVALLTRRANWFQIGRWISVVAIVCAILSLSYSAIHSWHEYQLAKESIPYETETIITYS